MLLWKCPMATKFGGKNPWPKCNALLGSKVMQGDVCQGQPGIKLLTMTYGNLGGRNLDRSVVHWWGLISCRGQPGQPGVKLPRNALWLPDLVGRTPDRKLEHCGGQKGHVGVSQGQSEVKLLRHAVWLPDLTGRTSDQSVMYWWSQWSFRVQPGVRVIKNALWQSNLVGKTLTKVYCIAVSKIM